MPPIGGSKAPGDILVPGGFLNSDVAGRTDLLPMRVPEGSHILPADVVSGLGQGNSVAGAAMFKELFDHYAPALPEAKAKGGRTHTEGAPSIVAAGGEYVVPPNVVLGFGGGNQKAGHDALDEMILNIRKFTAARLRKLPGPKK